MQHLTPLEPGVVFWGERDNLAEIRSLGVRCGQFITPGGMPLEPKHGRALDGRRFHDRRRLRRV